MAVPFTEEDVDYPHFYALLHSKGGRMSIIKKITLFGTVRLLDTAFIFMFSR